MRKPEQSAEPSIEEILASIRKIIADDGAQHSARADAFSETPPEAASRRRDAEPPRRQPPTQPVGAFFPEPEEPALALGEDDILELTEDSMVADDGGQSGMTFADPATPADPRPLGPMQAGFVGSGRSAPPSGAELESVFSSVVAEVQRLSGGAKPAAVAGAAVNDWPEPATLPPPKAPRQPLKAEPWDAPAAGPETAPKPAAAPPAAKPAQVQSRPAPKPVWSARHLDGEGPRGRAPQTSGDKPAEQPAPPVRQSMTGQESWDEGVQMAVPEGGPAMPFPDPDDEGDAAPPLSGSGESHAEIEKEKTFVGEMLTRVFGGSQKKAPEAPPPAAPRETPHSTDVRLAKAEDLAKATIADFASDKLRAPSVAQALHADKPFMDAITGSLATAMADAKADHDVGPAVRFAAQATIAEDELPELPLAPDAEMGMFGAPPSERSPTESLQGAPGNLFGRQPSAAAPRQASPFAEPPELPRGHLGDVFAEPEPEPAPRQTQGGIFGAAPEADRAAPPARTPPKPDLSAMMKSAALAGNTASPGIAFPAGLEDSIKELIKPLIVQWLNDNLPRIVEKAVREEITEQGLVSRARGDGGSRH